MERKTDNIVSINVIGYNESNSFYKIILNIKEDKNVIELKVNIKWNNINNGLKSIKKKINKNIYYKLLYDLESKVIINDKRYNSVKKFINGKNKNIFKKKSRQISDVQNFLNAILEYKNNCDYNKSSINCFLNKTFNIIN